MVTGGTRRLLYEEGSSEDTQPAWITKDLRASTRDFASVTNGADARVNCDPNQYFWWNVSHFSAAAHRWISQEMYCCLTPPLVIALQTGGPSGVLKLQWQGGSPPFRVQRCVTRPLACGNRTS